MVLACINKSFLHTSVTFIIHPNVAVLPSPQQQIQQVVEVSSPSTTQKKALPETHQENLKT
jgi:hypothetical protein